MHFWLLDRFFISPSIISFSTRKFKRRWRTMSKIRQHLNDQIVPLICYTSPPSPPPPQSLPVSRSTTPPPYLVEVEPPSAVAQIHTPPPCITLLPPTLKSSKRKRKKRKRRMDDYRDRAHVRPPTPPPILQVPLAVTSVPNRNINRSYGSMNARDPPETKLPAHLLC